MTRHPFTDKDLQQAIADAPLGLRELEAAGSTVTAADDWAKVAAPHHVIRALTARQRHLSELLADERAGRSADRARGVQLVRRLVTEAQAVVDAAPSTLFDDVEVDR